MNHITKMGMKGINGHHHENSKKKQPKQLPYLVRVPFNFLIIFIVAASTISLSVGLIGRRFLLEILSPEQVGACSARREESACIGHSEESPKSLPAPVIPEGKEIPNAVYTSKNFNIAASVRSSNPLIQKVAPGVQKVTTSEEIWIDENEDIETDFYLEEHFPAGQHLLVDIKNVDASFLNDEVRLAEAMIGVVTESKLTLLSYHCHALEPMGVSCAGVLLESHIAFHTWPEEGVITLDLFTCGSNPLIPVLQSLVRLFGVPMESDEDLHVEAPTYLWAHKLRGFRKGKDSLSADVGKFLLGVVDFDVKQEVISVKTEYQQIHIYDVIDPRFRDIQTYLRSLKNDTSYESRNRELFQPDRILFLDGFIQSSRLGDEAYHETLVHPGMFAHSNPRNVAIIGGGEGATLREVLKHKTVEKVVMVEIDEVMVNISKQFLPTWNDCSDLIDSADSCFDDPRAQVIFQDALQFFVDLDPKSEEDRFDVIIIDALDPEDDVPFAEALYNNHIFMEHLHQDLSEDGIIILQLGETATSSNPPDEMTRFKNRANLIHLLEQVGMKSFFPYDDFHPGFYAPWSYLVACKTSDCRHNWSLSEPAIDVVLHKRIKRNKSGKSPLKYFDSATMLSLQVPHKAFERLHCRRVPMPIDCEVIQKYGPNITADVVSIVSSASNTRYSPSYSRHLPLLESGIDYEMMKATTSRK